MKYFGRFLPSNLLEFKNRGVNMDMISSLCNQIRTFDITDKIALNATRHLKKSIRKKIFSSNNLSKGSAKGYWYEAIIYETFLELTAKNESIKGIVRKGPDVICNIPKPEIDQNGFFYNKKGDILIRGSGIDLGEFDLLLIDSDSNLSFVEITNSKQNLKNFENEIQYKKSLIKEICGQQSVPFLLISSIDISNSHVVQNILEKPDNYFVHIDPFKKNKNILNSICTKNNHKVENGNSKLICLNDIKVNENFDYVKLHNKLKKQLFIAVKNKNSIEKMKANLTSSIVTKVILGCVSSNSIARIFRDDNILIDGDIWDADRLKKHFNKIILAINLPEFRPIIYLKMKRKHEYMKIGPSTISFFESERVINHFSNGLIKSLDNTNDYLGYNMTKQIIDFFLNDEIAYSNKYRGTPSISKLINT